LLWNLGEPKIKNVKAKRTETAKINHMTETDPHIAESDGEKCTRV
jgi:hypothetical protein